MPTIALIVTGRVEGAALHLGLKRIFPEAEFLPTLRLEGFTSNPLPPVLNATKNTQLVLDKLVSAMVASLFPGRREVPADFVFMVDDLELVNQHQPALVVEHIKQAIKRKIAPGPQWPSEATRSKVEQGLREKASFHLFAPMVEAYFYGEPAALVRAGSKQASLFQPKQHDLEDFDVTDPAYTGWDSNAPWFQPAMKFRHPKHYLEFLCGPDGYQETTQGKSALQSLNWAEVLSQQEFASFGRAMLADIADAVGSPKKFPGAKNPLTSAKPNLLRNM